MSTDPLPPGRAGAALDDDCLDLLAQPMAGAGPGPLRERVLQRIGRSAEASRAFVTVRTRRARAMPLAEGVLARALYETAGTAPRPGEPARVRIIELAAGARWQADPLCGAVSEWLVMDGALDMDGALLQTRDFQRRPANETAPVLHSPTGARLYLRESSAAPGEARSTVLDACTPWQDFAPGIRRRVLWTDGREAALLYLADPGAAVPQHGHGHDEECLMLDGEVFLDDLLLCRGDWQLAPAGTAHEGVSTDTGGVLFAHGDLDLDIRTA
ncbi:cupin domain-containing protein [Aquabacterium humicola]|uniref:cupin domain-containing protein n=1 Tax=Aquabacterium humicola TaxID=3237377 RepID=UPI002542779A|nr:cupin domain-containing protein [Rubrivivax pictus]